MFSPVFLLAGFAVGVVVTVVIFRFVARVDRNLVGRLLGKRLEVVQYEHNHATTLEQLSKDVSQQYEEITETTKTTSSKGGDVVEQKRTVVRRRVVGAEEQDSSEQEIQKQSSPDVSRAVDSEGSARSRRSSSLSSGSPRIEGKDRVQKQLPKALSVNPINDPKERRSSVPDASLPKASPRDSPAELSVTGPNGDHKRDATSSSATTTPTLKRASNGDKSEKSPSSSDNDSKPKGMQITEQRIGGKSQHKSKSADAEPSGSPLIRNATVTTPTSAKEVKEKRRSKQVTALPLMEEDAPEEPPSPLQRSTSAPVLSVKKAEIMAPNHADPRLHGWMEIRTPLAVGKKVWHRRYFCLCSGGGWMAEYKDPQMRADRIHAWIQLAGCSIVEENKEEREAREKNGEKEKPPFVMNISHPAHRIFHLHGPQHLPPCKRKHFIWRRKHKNVKLRCSEVRVLKKWMEVLKEEIDKANQKSPASTPKNAPETSEEESDDSDNESLYRMAGFKSTPPPEADAAEQSTDDVQPPEPVSESLVVVLPDKGKALQRPLSKSSDLNSSVRKSRRTNSSQKLTESAEEKEGSSPRTESEQKGEAAPATEDTADPPVNEESRESLLKLLVSALDISQVALPVTLNEPLSFLQRMCEATQYYSLLNTADTCNDPCERLMYVAAFAVSCYSILIRTAKPFNPLLGETYEFVKDDYRFTSEQVSHHPPIGASYAESSHFQYGQDQCMKTKFGGNSLACSSNGCQRVVLKTHGDRFSWELVKTVVHNVILGKMWLDHFGETEIVNHSTGEKARIEFKKCGWFEKGRYEVKVWIVDAQGQPRIVLDGKWNEGLTATVLSGGSLQTAANGTRIWKHTILPDASNSWSLPPFAQELNKLDQQNILPPTDSRLRPDRLALDMRDIPKATAEKKRVEQVQRAQRSARDKKGDNWKPKYFTKEKDPDFGEIWKYSGGYFEERQQRVSNPPATPPKFFM